MNVATTTRPIALVAGYFVRYPLGGHVLSILHYLVGLQRLGYDVVFVEDHGWPSSCYDPETNSQGDDPTYGLARLQEWAGARGIRWCYVDLEGRFHGLSRTALLGLCRQAEVLLSLWQVTWLDEFFECRRRVFIDTDPGFTQFGMAGRSSTRGYASPMAFQTHFTYGVRIGARDCPIPTHGITWHPLRPPVALDLVPVRPARPAAPFTTVMGWNARAPIVYDGVVYGQKDVEFWKIADLPSRTGPVLEIALGGLHADVIDRMLQAGWLLSDAREVTATPETYLNYIASSRGEFSVAVNLVVKTRCGWFSDRTAAYLASGRPAVVQDTGFTEWLPSGLGLLPFTDSTEAAKAIADVNTRYAVHCRSAREIAERYFDSDRLLMHVLATAGCSGPVRH